MREEVLISLLYGSYIVLSFLALGYFIVSKFIFKVNKPNLPIQISVSLALGFGFYSLLYFFIYCSSSKLPVFIILALQTAGVILGHKVFYEIYKWVKTFKSKVKIPRIEITLWSILFILAALFLILLILVSLTPLKNNDAIIGYMETARWVYYNGFRTYDPYIPNYSTYPVLTEVIYSLSFAIHTEIAAKIVDGYFGLAFILAIYGFALLFMKRPLAIFAGLTFALVPGYSWLFGEGKLDIISQYILFAGLICLILNNKNSLNFRYLLISAILFGVAFAEKYTNVLFFPFFFIYTIYIFRKHKLNFSQIIANISLLGIIMIIIILPHWTKDFIWLNNPFAPFNNPFFHSDIKILQPTYGEHYSTSWIDALLLPYSFSVQHKLPLIAMIGLVFYILKKIKNKAKNINPLVLFGVIEVTIWMIIFKTYWYNERFILAFIALFLCLTILQFQEYYLKYKIARWLVLTYFIICFCFEVYNDKRYANYTKYISGKQTQAEWEDQYGGHKSFNILNNISDSLDDNHKLFMYTWNIIYPIRYDKVKFVSTSVEKDEAMHYGDFKKYLKMNHYCYVYVFNYYGQMGNDFPPSLKNKIVFKDEDGVIYRI